KPDLRDNPDDPSELGFGFVVDFPMFEKDPVTGQLSAQHHPFCMPHPDDIEKLDTDPASVRAWSYDMVLNGYEMASGSIRIHQPELQKKIFTLLGISPEEIERRFGHMLQAFRFGAPPHGGMAPGIDRLTMILAGEPNIREVMAFPKTGDAREPMTGAPTSLPAQQLKDVHITTAELKTRTR
ncbi:MAG: amino acid--tRNA ligase-related protein, partial [Patescibacteria group bacterium]